MLIMLLYFKQNFNCKGVFSLWYCHFYSGRGPISPTNIYGFIILITTLNKKKGTQMQ